MRNNKICHITTAHQPFDDRIFHKECKTLAKNGFSVFLIAQYENDQVIEDIHIIALPKNKSRIHRIALFPIIALIKAVKTRADIYHFHDPELILTGVILKIITGKIIIYDVHENYSKQILSKNYIPREFRNIISKIYKIIEYKSSLFISGIVTATDDILNNFSYHKNAISARNFPILDYLPLINKPIIKKNDKFILIYEGGISKERGIIQTIKALELIDILCKVKLYMYGKFDPPELKNELKKLKGFQKAIYKGYVEYRKIPLILEKANAGIVCFLPFPNHISALPNKLGEYMMAGLPVIASNFPLWKEIIEDNECGICVDPTKPEEIARAIKYLIDNPEKSKKMGENGRKAVLEKYNWEIEGEKLLKLYNKLLNM